MKKEINIKVKYTFPICTFLTILFTFCKIFQIGIIKEWSWRWVLSPIWLPFAIYGAFVIIGFVIAFVYVIVRETIRAIKESKSPFSNKNQK